MTMFFIASTGSLSGSTSSFTFSGIPSTFTHLQVRATSRFTGSANLQSIIVYPNSNGSADKSIHRMFGNGSSVASQAFTSQNFWSASGIPCANDTANAFGSTIIDILDYANTNKNRVIRVLTGSDLNGSGEVHLQSGLWISTVAINALLIAAGNGNFAAGSRFDLYGINSSEVTGA